MKLTMMEAKILLTCQGGAVLWSSELGAVMEGLEERQKGAEQMLVAYDKRTMACTPTGAGVALAKRRVREKCGRSAAGVVSGGW